MTLMVRMATTEHVLTLADALILNCAQMMLTRQVLPSAHLLHTFQVL